MTEPGRGQDWLSATLRDLRKAAGLSGMEAARRLDTSQRRISNIETGRLRPARGRGPGARDTLQSKPAIRRELLEVVRACVLIRPELEW